MHMDIDIYIESLISFWKENSNQYFIKEGKSQSPCIRRIQHFVVVVKVCNGRMPKRLNIAIGDRINLKSIDCGNFLDIICNFYFLLYT